MTNESNSDYTNDWPRISADLKGVRLWRCEICKYRNRGSGLIQVHHIDGDKSDNSRANLQVVCAICHGSKHGNSPLWPYAVSEAEKAELKTHHSAYALRSN